MLRRTFFQKAEEEAFFLLRFSWFLISCIGKTMSLSENKVHLCLPGWAMQPIVYLAGLQKVLVLAVWYLFDMQNIVLSPGTQGFPCCRTEKKISTAI